MKKVVALACVVSWFAFWAFGYLALSADMQNDGQIMVSAALAAVGFLVGIFAYLRLCQDCPMSYKRVWQE